jgi:predicted transcriptional regulator of viral defense system
MSYIEAMPQSTTLGRLAAFTEDQWGLITRRQAEQAGISAATVQRLVSTGVLLRVTTGVYQVAGAPTPDSVDLRAAWLQLAPGVPAWERGPERGVVSHRSGAALYGLGHLPADRHEFVLPVRRQSRRADVRLHVRPLGADEWAWVRGLPVTTPTRIAGDLLDDREDPGSVGQVIADALRSGLERPDAFGRTLARYAAQLGQPRQDGLAALRFLLDLTDDPAATGWLRAAGGSDA